MSGRREEYKMEETGTQCSLRVGEDSWKKSEDRLCSQSMKSEEAVRGQDSPFSRGKRALQGLATLFLWSSAFTPVTDYRFYLLIPIRIRAIPGQPGTQQDSTSKEKKKKKSQVHRSVVEHLPSTIKELGSVPSTTKKHKIKIVRQGGTCT